MKETRIENAIVVRYGAVLDVTVMYPRNSDINTVEVNLSDVRAADGIRVKYDFDRDGWSISQASTFAWDADVEEEGKDSDWQEVAFVQAWAREKKEGGSCTSSATPSSS